MTSPPIRKPVAEVFAAAEWPVVKSPEFLSIFTGTRKESDK